MNYWFTMFYLSLIYHLPIIYLSHYPYRWPLIDLSHHLSIDLASFLSCSLSFTSHLPITIPIIDLASSYHVPYHLPIIYLSFTYHVSLPIIYLSCIVMSWYWSNPFSLKKPTFAPGWCAWPRWKWRPSPWAAWSSRCSWRGKRRGKQRGRSHAAGAVVVSNTYGKKWGGQNLWRFHRWWRFMFWQVDKNPSGFHMAYPNSWMVTFSWKIPWFEMGDDWGYPHLGDLHLLWPVVAKLWF